jgi:hypothetical protein
VSPAYRPRLGRFQVQPPNGMRARFGIWDHQERRLVGTYRSMKQAMEACLELNRKDREENPDA